MRHFKSTALALGLLLSGAAYAAESTSLEYNMASMTVTAEGAYGEAVNFTIPNATIPLDTKALKPGQLYTVTVPVTNTTDRPIRVTLKSLDKFGTAANEATVVATTNTVDIAPGLDGILTFTVQMSENTDAGLAGKTLRVRYTIEGIADFLTD